MMLFLRSKIFNDFSTYMYFAPKNVWDMLSFFKYTIMICSVCVGFYGKIIYTVCATILLSTLVDNKRKHTIYIYWTNVIKSCSHEYVISYT
jgi:hypothetical protein